MRKIIPAAGAAVLAAVLAACGSTSGSKSIPVTTTTSKGAVTTSGTEIIYGQVTGKAVLAKTQAIPLTLKGPVNTTATVHLRNDAPKKGQSRTFHTAAGNFVITAVKNPAKSQKFLGTQACGFTFGDTIAYVIDGPQSTGAFKGATGHGLIAVVFRAFFAKKNGACTASPRALPLAKGASATFSGTGPLTVIK